MKLPENLPQLRFSSKYPKSVAVRQQLPVSVCMFMALSQYLIPPLTSCVAPDDTLQVRKQLRNVSHTQICAKTNNVARSKPMILKGIVK